MKMTWSVSYSYIRALYQVEFVGSNDEVINKAVSLMSKKRDGSSRTIRVEDFSDEIHFFEDTPKRAVRLLNLQFEG